MLGAIIPTIRTAGWICDRTYRRVRKSRRERGIEREGEKEDRKRDRIDT